MRGAGLVAVAAAALLAAGCSGRERVAADPLDIVAAKLSSMPEEANAMDIAMQAMGTEHYLETRGADELVWHFTMNGVDYCRFTARLVAAGPDKTRIITRAEDAPQAADAAVAEGRQRPDYSYLCSVARIAGDESIAATLESRPADTKAIYDRIARNVAANPAGMMRSVEAVMDEAASEMDEYDPCEDVTSERCRDWESLQAVREEQRREAEDALPPERSGSSEDAG